MAARAASTSLSELQMDLLSLQRALTGEPPQTDCRELTLSDSGSKSGARREGSQSDGRERAL